MGAVHPILIIDDIAPAIYIPADIGDAAIELFDTMVHLGKREKEIRDEHCYFRRQI